MEVCRGLLTVTGMNCVLFFYRLGWAMAMVEGEAAGRMFGAAHLFHCLFFPCVAMFGMWSRKAEQGEQEKQEQEFHRKFFFSNKFTIGLVREMLKGGELQF